MIYYSYNNAQSIELYFFRAPDLLFEAINRDLLAFLN